MEDEILRYLLNLKNLNYNNELLILGKGKYAEILFPKWMSNAEKDEYLTYDNFEKELSRLGYTVQQYYDVMILGIESVFDRPKCPVCSKYTEFRGLFNGYKKCCSRSCITKNALTPEVRERISKTLTGRKDSDEVKLHKSIARKGHRWSEEVKEKIRKSNLGQKRSEETKKKISENSKKQFESEEAREKSRVRMIKYCEDHPEFLDNFIANGIYNSKRGYVKLNKFHESDGNYFYMSTWEEDLLLKLDSLDYIREIKRPPRIKYVFEGKSKIYVPDILVELTTGEVVIIEVKPMHFIMDEKVVAKRIYAASYCQENGYKYITITNYGIYDKDFNLYKYIN